MILRGYNITLRRLTSNDIEMVRHWRNSQAVNPYMEYRDYITEEQQRAWFKKIDTIYHNFFLIVEQGEPVGLIYGSEIDWEKGITGNGGIFLRSEDYFLTDIPLRASFLVIETGILWGLTRQYAKILRDNERAKFFNKKLGWQIMEGEEDNYNQRYYLTAERYMEFSRSFKKIMGFRDEEEIELVLEDITHPVDKNAVHIYQRMDEASKKRIKLVNQ